MKDNRILFFDGLCGGCNKFVMFIYKNDTSKKIKFVSIQSDLARKLIGDKIVKDKSTIYYYDSGDLKSESNAVLSLCYQIKFPYKLLAIFYIVPSFIRNYFYKTIARNRYRIFGKVNHCQLIDRRVCDNDRFII